ncbi:tetratricopeptide repeat protein [Chloroflexales bacterium ZM16-3]|nr:tetratricopeptide repeat protein [Chloroflexales bacterium ZM16-3]
MPTTDLELIIARAADGMTSAALRVELPNRRADLVPPEAIKLKPTVLLEYADDPDSYGAMLTAMLFTPALREGWQRARGYAEGANAMRVRLVLNGDDGLHAIRWELLRDPIDGAPLAYTERTPFSRYLATPSLADVQAPAKPALRAVVAVANPATLPTLRMAPVDVPGEVAWAQVGLGDIPTTILDGTDGRPAASLANIAAALRDGAQILYLTCHGKLNGDQSYLYLEQEGNGRYQPVDGTALVQMITQLTRRPLLVVLASCQGAGDTYQLLAAVGPRLAQAGVGAVIAMQGNVPMELVATLTPRLFTELRRDGQIDRALAAARSALPASGPWWMPVLWMAVKDGALWRSPTETVRGAGVFQVPYPPNPLFRGRDAEMDALAAVLLGEGNGTAAVLPAIAGTGGIGKTQLASEFAHRHRDQFPGGVFWLSMAEEDAVATQVAAAGGPGRLDLPGWAGLDFEGKIAAVRRAWAEPTRRLLVFDNLEDPKLLQNWRPIGGGARVLLTTRRGVWSATSGVQAIRLPTLVRPESVRLMLTPRYGAQLETVLAEPAVATEADAICEEVGDLPLALALAGAYLEQTPSLSLAGYRARLTETLLQHPSLDAELDEGLPTNHAESVAATIALSYQQLDATKPADVLSLTLLHHTAFLAPAPIPQPLLVRLIDRDPDDESQAIEVDAPLRRLVSVGLIELLPAGGAILHRLVAAFVRDQVQVSTTIQHTLATVLFALLVPINKAGYPLASQPYLLHVQHVAKDSREEPSAASLLNELGYLLQAQGDYAAARPYYERALAIRERVLGADHPDTALSLNNLGYLLHAQRDYAAARPYYERALAIRERVLGTDHPATALSLNNLGYLLHAQGDYAAARPYYERALAIRERVLGADHPDTARSLNNLGGLLHAQGDYPAARPYYERALAIRERVLGADHPDTALSLNNLGALLDSQGDYAAARPYYERALAINERVLGADHPDTARSLNNLGSLLQAQHDYAAARPYYERALAIFTARLGTQHPLTQTVQRNLAALGAPQEARKVYRPPVA